MATLNTDIRYIKGVGEARAKSLAKLGITDLRSLLSYFPRAYDDRRGDQRDRQRDRAHLSGMFLLHDNTPFFILAKGLFISIQVDYNRQIPHL